MWNKSSKSSLGKFRSINKFLMWDFFGVVDKIPTIILVCSSYLEDIIICLSYGQTNLYLNQMVWFLKILYIKLKESFGLGEFPINRSHD